MKSLKGINRYLSVGVEANWIRYYLKDQQFQPGNRKTDSMFCFMNDACITNKKKLTEFGRFLQSQDMNSTDTWALLLCNLAYSPAFRWYIQNIPFSEEYIESRLVLDMGEDTSKKDGGKKARGEFWNGFKVILDTTKEFREIGFGIPVIESKVNKNGEIKKSMIALTRSSWEKPNDKVILYSLYKFAEECGNYYQFTLTRLMDSDIESDGISPAEIFGLKKDTMQRLINGLAFNYPDFIKAKFTLDLDIISLNPEKKSEDVLSLF